MEQVESLMIKELMWDDARKDLLKFEPELCSIIDKLSPDKKYPFFKVSYLFGDTIYNKGIVHLPTRDKHTIPLNHSQVPNKIKEQLGYNPLPPGLVTGQGVEVYSELQDRVFSLAYFTHGLNLGIWEMFSPPTPFTVSAGARSLFMLPKITEATSHKKLKRFGVRSPMPQKPFDQWHIFKEAAHHKDFYEPWVCDVLFFSAKWIEQIKTDNAWREFYNFLLKRAWNHTEYGRNKIMLDTVWESFARLLTSKRIKPISYNVEILKHLVFVATGALPAFKPATDNQAAPINGLLKMYLEDYELKNYAPSLMQPYHFSPKEPLNYVYYALQIPTYLESIPKSRTPSSARIDLAELEDLIDQFMSDFIGNHNVNDGKHHIYDLLNNIKFDYFHSEADARHNIRSAEQMPVEDNRFLYLPDKKYGKRRFCERSTFARGCVRISKKVGSHA